jgi:hypothetical protein
MAPNNLNQWCLFPVPRGIIVPVILYANHDNRMPTIPPYYIFGMQCSKFLVVQLKACFAIFFLI